VTGFCCDEDNTDYHVHPSLVLRGTSGWMSNVTYRALRQDRSPNWASKRHFCLVFGRNSASDSASGPVLAACHGLFRRSAYKSCGTFGMTDIERVANEWA
jgi:hypothetical protein